MAPAKMVPTRPPIPIPCPHPCRDREAGSQPCADLPQDTMVHISDETDKRGASMMTRHARPCAGHPRLQSQGTSKGVDGRDLGERSDAVLRTAMPGHDESAFVDT